VCFACVSIHEHTLFRVRQLLCVCARALEERNRECVRERESERDDQEQTLHNTAAPCHNTVPQAAAVFRRGRPLKVCLCLCLVSVLHVRVLRGSRGIGEQGAQKRLARDLLSASRKQPGSRHSAHRDHPQLMRARTRMHNSRVSIK
jgi:hypothetical protein